MSLAAKKVIENNPYVREEREKKEAADNKKKTHADKNSENRKGKRLVIWMKSMVDECAAQSQSKIDEKHDKLVT